jgi:hypothetical protein
MGFEDTGQKGGERLFFNRSCQPGRSFSAMKRLLRVLGLCIVILVISIFPVFMSTSRSIWESKEDTKKIAEQTREQKKKLPD